MVASIDDPPVATLAAAAFGRLLEPRTMLIGGALFAVVYASIDPNRFERVIDIARRFLLAQEECTLTPVDRCPAGSSFIEADGFPEMVAIPAGMFTMGSPDNHFHWQSAEGPQQDIKIARFALARSEVTFDQWEACVTDGFCMSMPDDEDWGRSSRPVINVSWNDAQEFIDWLNSAVEGDPYRLPSEAEWEYAARAGEDAAYPWGSTWDAAQANGNSDVGQTTKVGSYPANEFGLVDMIGNVFELTEDCWRNNLRNQPEDGASVKQGLGADCSRRVVRGGSWDDISWFLRPAYRGWLGRDRGENDLGFRPARTLTP